MGARRGIPASENTDDRGQEAPSWKFACNWKEREKEASGLETGVEIQETATQERTVVIL